MRVTSLIRWIRSLALASLLAGREVVGRQLVAVSSEPVDPRLILRPRHLLWWRLDRSGAVDVHQVDAALLQQHLWRKFPTQENRLAVKPHQQRRRSFVRADGGQCREIARQRKAHPSLRRDSRG